MNSEEKTKGKYTFDHFKKPSKSGKCQDLLYASVLILFTLLNLWAACRISLVHENITALGHTYHQPLLLAAYTILFAFLLSYGSARFLNQKDKNRCGILLSPVLCALSGLIPYQPQGSVFFNDLHVWFCAIGIGIWYLSWTRQVFFPVADKDLFKVWIWITFGLGCGLILFAFTGHVSALCEISTALILTWSLFINSMIQNRQK